MSKPSNEVFSFRVSVKEKPEWGETVNARTAGMAKSEYHRRLTDAWPGIPYTALRCQKLGAAFTSSQFTRNAEYRGLSEVRCGDRVAVGDASGVVVGHDCSANFEVLFDVDSPKYPNLRLSVHPSELKTLTN